MPEPPDIRADFLTLPEARSILAKIHPGEDILRAIFRIPHRAPESRDTNSRSPARTDLQFPEGTKPPTGRRYAPGSPTFRSQKHAGLTYLSRVSFDRATIRGAVTFKHFQLGYSGPTSRTV